MRYSLRGQYLHRVNSVLLVCFAILSDSVKVFKSIFKVLKKKPLRCLSDFIFLAAMGTGSDLQKLAFFFRLYAVVFAYAVVMHHLIPFIYIYTHTHCFYYC